MNKFEKGTIRCNKAKLQIPRIISKSPVSFNFYSEFDIKFDSKIPWSTYSTRKSSIKKERHFSPYRNSQQNLKTKLPFNNLSDEEIQECS